MGKGCPRGKREMLRQVYAFRLKSRCGTSMHAWSAYAQRCIYLRSRFRRAHQFLSVTTLIVHVANLRTLARSTKGQWLAFARKCTRRRHALSQIFIACVPPEYDNSSMQIMLWSFARKMWKRVGAKILSSVEMHSRYSSRAAFARHAPLQCSRKLKVWIICR